MGLFGTTDPRAVHSAWVFVIFGCVHTCLGESLATALVEVKFNSLTLAALSFNTAKDLLVFSISPLSRSREIEFSLNIAYRLTNQHFEKAQNVKSYRIIWYFLFSRIYT